jgi:malate dehydrogenase
VVEIQLNASEKKMFENSVAAVKELIRACKKIDPGLVQPRKRPRRARK